jgi:D-tyrosyl-tRNA(Tyr) deacylase
MHVLLSLVYIFVVGEELISEIGRGLCVLLGISKDDSSKEAEWMAKKLLNLRVFDDEDGKPWSKCVAEKKYEILCVSQFTLCHVLKGNKPDFHNALTSEKSEPMYLEFLEMIGKMYTPEKIKPGKFGAYMQVHIQNDGPVTLHIESPSFPPPKERKPQGPPKKKASEGGGKNSDKELEKAVEELDVSQS